MWRRFLSLPHTRLGWWAVGLAVIASITMAMVAFPLPGFVDAAIPSSWDGIVEIIVVPTAGVAPLASGVVGSLALGAGERSLLVWFAQVPPAIFFAVLLNLFQEGSPWGRASVGVLFWALIAFSIIFLRSQERSS
jgi:hypothetical protein